MYSREIDGKVLTITTSGWTYFNQHMLFDHETESFWFHMEGSNDLTCVAGHYAGRKLLGVSAHYGPWNVWVTEHPDSKILKSQQR